ncbi:MAG: SCP2 sterol-binding domain-containing protein [Actinomycetota bacterium]
MSGAGNQEENGGQAPETPAAGGAEAGDAPLRYLSPAWIERADTLLNDLQPLDEAVVVSMVVTGGPDGDRSYQLVLGPDRVAMAADRIDGGVEMTMTWDVAVSIANGEASAQRAFLDGRLQLGGDPAVLLGHQKALAAIDDRLQPLREVTDYG